MHPKEISILDYTYDLPDERIALRPLAERDSSRLLIYQQGAIREAVYRDIDACLPEQSLLVFNNTKVIRARVLFQKPTGGVIEIFCLEPHEAISEYSYVMNKKGQVRWKCLIGGASKWKEGPLQKELAGEGAATLTLQARLVEKLPDAYVVEFSWEPADWPFAAILEQAGDIPLPPYIKRETDIADTDRYQTIYARDEGSVAAPTAGLHFTETVFEKLAARQIRKAFVTLHVGAGTFKPVKASQLEGHIMHAEWIDVETGFLEQLIAQLGKPVVAVGTTSLRTLESLYWMGVKAALQPELTSLTIQQWEVYETPLAETSLTAKEALESLWNWLKKNRQKRLFTQTQILIAPGYRFKLANYIITNFHQPQSTLLLLVAAAIGNDWRKVYEYALDHGFRFLSYGDGSLLEVMR
ncbi:MAG: S-adenosylmethionine:tRNA ribosyltransferase-isomerase [Ferruginibacter sp.]